MGLADRIFFANVGSSTLDNSWRPATILLDSRRSTSVVRQLASSLFRPRRSAQALRWGFFIERTMDVVWRPLGHRFLAQSTLGRIGVDLTHPENGVSIDLALGNDQWREMGQLFSLVEFPLSNRLFDSFCRQGDLWGSYTESEVYPLKTQIAWRLFPEDLCAGNWGADDELILEIVLSTQTELLAARPHTRVECCMSSKFTQHLSPMPLAQDRCESSSDPFSSDYPRPFAYLLAWPEAAAVIAVHPSDLDAGIGLTSRSDKHVCAARLRLHDMEKGVIRRARMLFALLPAGNIPALSELVERFRYSAAPLSV